MYILVNQYFLYFSALQKREAAVIFTGAASSGGDGLILYKVLCTRGHSWDSFSIKTLPS